MIISKKIRNVWRTLIERGDIELMSKEFGCQRQTVGRALKTGKCDLELYTKLSNFFNERQKEIEKINIKL